jgi:predicted glycosyltransferase
MILEHPKSLLMYSHDGFGLGHLKRNFNIAKRWVQESPGNQALLLMGHNSVPFHPIPHGVDFVKLPSIIKTRSEQWAPRHLTMPPETFKELRSSLIENVAEHFKPDLFLVDYVPKGVWGELVPTLKLLRGRKTKIVLGLRDIIDDPKRTCRRWKNGRTYETIRDYYDKILIYGSEDIYRTANHYGIQDDLADKVSYCGYLCSDEECLSPDKVRLDLQVEKERLIVITAGGGGDAYPMMRKCLEAIALLQLNDSEVLMITGPLMDPRQIQALRTLAESLPVKVLTSTEKLLSLMNAADLLVTMGSYNTMMEAVRVNRPAIVIPREGPSREQQIRAKIFADGGFVTALEPPASLPAAHLAETMVKAMDSQQAFNRHLNMNGLSRAMEELHRCLDVTIELPEAALQEAAVMV